MPNPSERKYLPLTEIIRTFQLALLAVAPHAEKVGVPWQEGKAYDGWDRIEEGLFASMVSDCVVYLDESVTYPLPLINNSNFNPATESLLFDETLGDRLRFLALSHEAGPFASASFLDVSEHKDREIIERDLNQCSFVVLTQTRTGAERRLSRVGCVG